MSSSFRYRINPFSVLSVFKDTASILKISTPIHYADLRNELRTGDLLLCAGTGWFSQMIQAATDSVWSHVAFVVRLEVIDRIMVLESLEPVGVRTVPLSKYLSRVRLGVLPDPRYRYPARPARLRHSC
jgi:hypothetical protein